MTRQTPKRRPPRWRLPTTPYGCGRCSGSDLRSAQVTLGRLWRSGEELAEIRPVEPSAQEAFSFLAEEVFSAGLRLGDPVAVRHEAGAPGVFITTLEPALDVARRSDPKLASPPPPAHLDALLDESRLSARSGDVPPLRRVAYY